MKTATSKKVIAGEKYTSTDGREYVARTTDWAVINGQGQAVAFFSTSKEAAHQADLVNTGSPYALYNAAPLKVEYTGAGRIWICEIIDEFDGGWVAITPVCKNSARGT